MNEPINNKVKIRLPVDLNGIDESLELPFIMGVLGDFVGNPIEPLPHPRLRKFVTIDLENFNDVLLSFSPRLSYKVENKLRDDSSDFEVELNFKSLADFDADNVKNRLERLDYFQQWIRREAAAETDYLEAKMSAQLESIMQHQAFKALEASWRGLHYLLENTDNDIQIKVIHTRKTDLLKDFERNEDLSTTAFYNWVYEREFNAVCGEPFSVLIGIYEFSNHPQDVVLLSYISKVAALAHAPFISGMSPDIWGYDYFLEVFEKYDPSYPFCRSEFTRWNEFRETEEAAYASLCLPRILLRNNSEDMKPLTKNYLEVLERISRQLWGNAALAFAVVLARSFAATKWLAQIDGEKFGALENVPTVRLWYVDSPIDTVVDEEVLYFFRYLSDESVNVITKAERNGHFFLSATSCKKFKPLPPFDLRWKKPPVDEDLRVSALLSVILTRARFLHYLVRLIRIESSRQTHSVQEWQEILNNWLGQYCANSFEECSVERPLAEARIEIEEAVFDAKPLLTAKIYIKPGYQLPNTNSIREISFSNF